MERVRSRRFYRLGAAVTGVLFAAFAVRLADWQLAARQRRALHRLPSLPKRRAVRYWTETAAAWRSIRRTGG